MKSFYIVQCTVELHNNKCIIQATRHHHNNTKNQLTALHLLIFCSFFNFLCEHLFTFSHSLPLRTYFGCAMQTRQAKSPTISIPMFQWQNIFFHLFHSILCVKLMYQHCYCKMLKHGRKKRPRRKSKETNMQFFIIIQKRK